MSRRREQQLAFGPYRFDTRRGALHVDGERIDLPGRAAGVLECLLQQPGTVVAKQEIIDAVWSDAAVTENSLTEAIGLLRKVFDDDPSDPTYIQTVHGRGYRFLPPVSILDEQDRGAMVRLPRQTARDSHPEGRSWKGLGILIAGIVLGLLVAVLGARLLPEEGTHRISRAGSQKITLSLPDGHQSSLRSSLAISPSGDAIGWNPRAEVGWRLRHLDTGETFPIGLFHIFFSPDGRQIAGFRPSGHYQGGLYTAPVTGGSHERIAHLGSRSPRAGAWGPDGSLVIDVRGAGLYRLPAIGSELEPLTELDGTVGETDHRWPQVLPDDRVLFTVFAKDGPDRTRQRRVALVDPRTGERTRILEDGGLARYVPTGHIVFSRSGRLFAVPFDLDRLQVVGAPVAVGPKLRTCLDCNTPAFDVSRSGTLVYMTGDVRQPQNEVLVKDRAGDKIRSLRLPAGYYRAPSLSPGERRLALTVQDVSGVDLIIYDLDRDTHSRLSLPGEEAAPVWTPGGKWIVYASRGDGGRWNVYRVRADGSSAPEPIVVDADRSYFPWSVSPDGSSLALSAQDSETTLDIYTVSVDDGSEETREPEPFLRTPHRESGPMFTSDGKWIVYHSNETGRFQIYARPYPGPGPRVRLSNRSGGWPLLARGDRELFHRTNPPLEDHVAAVSLRWSDRPDALQEQLVFQHDGGGRVSPEASAYAVTDDGTTFYIPTATEPSPLNDEIHLIVNWFEELRRQVPTGE